MSENKPRTIWHENVEWVKKSELDAKSHRIKQLEALDSAYKTLNGINKELIGRINKLETALSDMLNSKALQEAPFYNYCESVVRARQALSGEGENGK